MLVYTYSDVSKMIDHSLLNPTLTFAAMSEGIQLAIDYDVASVCILPYSLAHAASLLIGTTVKAGTTIGFPHGSHTTAVKLAETRQALADGGEELDMVVNISAVLSGRWELVKEDIRTVVEETHAAGQKVKVIFENAYLNEEQKIRLCETCAEVNADWVKTSTGYAPSGATHEDLILMRQHSPPHVQVKAAGGVSDLDALLAIRALGVSRCGATRTAAMMDEARTRLGLEPIVSTTARPAPSVY
jgi:deoxyribose-phosphate aldolase